MEEKNQYISLISEIIEKQAVILGPDIALLKARNVLGLVIDNNGKVSDIKGNPADVVQQLIDEYVQLSGQIVKGALSSIFTKYPDIKKVE
ncbi:MAG: hypothetical protein NT026_01540 [Candidatus Staskawiczbacteria bacterium]|nr:hypothetical protein [Candidatus Staskawiczbacteria bacterium]